MISIQVCLFSHLYLNHNEVVFFLFFFCHFPQMAVCCLVPPASLAEAGRGHCGSTATPLRPPLRVPVKLGFKLRLGSLMSAGWRKTGFLLHRIQVRHFYSALVHLWELQLEVHLFDRAGALELWELSDKEGLLLNRFTKHEHNDIVTSVSPVTGGSNAVTGSMDCRSDSDSLRLWKTLKKKMFYFIFTVYFGQSNLMF